MNARSLIAAVALPALVAASFAFPASAAPSYDGCTGTVTSIPTVISTQGTWCLKGDVATAIAMGVAIDIQANNVILDCNGFKVGGLAAGLSTATFGVVTTKLNTVIRNCSVRGFNTGILASGSGGIVEDNRLEANTAIGIQGEDGNVIRRNLVLDTGGSPGAFIYAIIAIGNTEVSDNRVDGTTVGTGNNSGGTGIYGAAAEGMVIRDNVVMGIHDVGSAARPLLVQSGNRTVISGNVVSGVPSASVGIGCPSGQIIVRDNTVLGFTVEDGDCVDGGGNWFN